MSNLEHVQDRIVVKVDMNYKNSHSFEDGTKIHLARKYDNFNMRYVNPVNAIVVSGENIPSGAEILVHHNIVHETNRITNYTNLSGEDIASDIRYFSILESECFAYYDGTKWLPLPGFDFGLRIFKPYIGPIAGIEPELIKNVIFVNTGIYKNKVCITLPSSDYEIIFQDNGGREGRLIRFRSCDEQSTQREAEIVAIHDEYTDMVLNGDLLIGITKQNAKKYESKI